MLEEYKQELEADRGRIISQLSVQQQAPAFPSLFGLFSGAIR